MIDTRYLKYISADKHDECYNSLIKSVYYFYYGVMISNDEIIVCVNGNKYDLDKTNLKIIKNNQKNDTSIIPPLYTDMLMSLYQYLCYFLRPLGCFLGSCEKL